MRPGERRRHWQRHLLLHHRHLHPGPLHQGRHLHLHRHLLLRLLHLHRHHQSRNDPRGRRDGFVPFSRRKPRFRMRSRPPRPRRPGTRSAVRSRRLPVHCFSKTLNSVSSGRRWRVDVPSRRSTWLRQRSRRPPVPKKRRPSTVRWRARTRTSTHVPRAPQRCASRRARPARPSPPMRGTSRQQQTSLQRVGSPRIKRRSPKRAERPSTSVPSRHRMRRHVFGLPKQRRLPGVELSHLGTSPPTLKPEQRESDMTRRFGTPQGEWPGTTKISLTLL